MTEFHVQIFLTYIAKTIYDKPVIIVNHTADFSHPDLRRIAEEIYPLFDDVVFRDSIFVSGAAYCAMEELLRMPHFCLNLFHYTSGYRFQSGPPISMFGLIRPSLTEISHLFVLEVSAIYGPY